MKYAVEIKKLKKNYQNFNLKIDNLNIPSGVVVGLIGENGAGKTTLIKLLLNAINKNDGEIKIFDKDLKHNEIQVKEDIGVVLDNSFFPETLNAKNIDTIMKDIYKRWDSKLFYKYLNDFKIKDNQILKAMSKGMRKKVEIATALSHHPKLLILDEATSGLDPIVRNEILDLFFNFIEDEEHTIILSTHITSDLEHIADYIVFIDKGEVVLEKQRDEIIDNYGILKCDTDQFNKIDKLDIVSFKKNKYNYEILIDDKEKCQKKYKDFIIDKITLEDLMLLIIKGGK
ncbi:MAG TPA: ABC transporter ATP-binding protein [Erysipelotrichaceae bacterium]|nr:ABC transporter ATP-binding protein [Erysipelotrichaceae bacterium]